MIVIELHNVFIRFPRIFELICVEMMILSPRVHVIYVNIFIIEERVDTNGDGLLLIGRTNSLSNCL